ncbi:MAG: metalloregulator ArsR/SmtB family transcription factor [Thermaerobacter sp.]|nr:metalloregulator ArsR/SmtB family transcription factor [Thermaerobacter sp.]
MSGQPDFSSVLSLIAEPSRVAMLVELMEGTMLPAGELARRAGITAQTASGHLSLLAQAGLVKVEAQGRHRYYRLASEPAANALEALLVLAPPTKVRSLRESDALRRLRKARTCYDHVAGELGVALEEALRTRGALVLDGRNYVLTGTGEELLSELGVNVPALRSTRRAFARTCLDWSERRYHVAGALGAAVATQFTELGWLQRIPGGRALCVTQTGREGLEGAFGLRLD